MKHLVFFISYFLFSLYCLAQTDEWSFLHRGNRAYRSKDFKTAEYFYRKALEHNPQSTHAAINLGDAYLQQKNAKAALEQFEIAGKFSNSKHLKSVSYHNQGYVHHINKEYEKAIDAYKEALRNNPQNEDTRYNLTLCIKMLQQQKKDSQPKQQSPPPKMRQDNAEQLLQLAKQTEQQTRKKIQQAGLPRRKSLNKNW